MRINRKWIWIILGSAAILLRLLLSFVPEVTEMLYSRGIFLGIRLFIDYTLGWMPFPFLFLLFAGLVYLLIKKTRNLIQTHQSFWQTTKRVLFSTVSFLFAVVFFFLVLWGYNYGRVPVEETLELDTKPLSLEELKVELDATTSVLSEARNNIPNQSEIAMDGSFLPNNLEESIREDVENLLEKLGYPTIGEVRGRLLRPKGILLRFSTAGVYFPWTGESNIDAGLHPIQIPFTLAHEFAHGYGFTAEGTCNFLAYLACSQSENPFFQYSGTLGYWRYLASSYRRMDRENYSDYFQSLPKGVVADLYAIDENTDKYPDILPKLRDVAYDTYLKTQGISEGLKSYNRVVMLVKAWKDKMDYYRINPELN